MPRTLSRESSTQFRLTVAKSRKKNLQSNGSGGHRGAKRHTSPGSGSLYLPYRLVPPPHRTSLDNGIWLLISSWCLRDKCQDAPSPAPSIKLPAAHCTARDLAHQGLNLPHKGQREVSQKTYNTSKAAMAGLRQPSSLEAPANAGAGAVGLWGLPFYLWYVCREWGQG